MSKMFVHPMTRKELKEQRKRKKEIEKEYTAASTVRKREIILNGPSGRGPSVKLRGKDADNS